mmetsp:Transcript_17757/g.39759  ORF Transcript_17757/g.39759 Transcript_17757/m.39759 type:complete len:303 (+) Transcript_17757:1137-2045(+)
MLRLRLGLTDEQLRRHVEHRAVDVDADLAFCLGRRLELLQLVRGQAAEMIADCLCLPFEDLPHAGQCLLGQGISLDNARLLKGRAGSQAGVGGFRVHREIVCRSIRDAHALDPPECHLNLRVPAVARVVRHLVGEMLTKPHVLRLAARPHEEEISPSDVVPERLVSDLAALHSVPQLADHGGLHAELLCRREEKQLKVCHLHELRMRLVARLDEILNLGLGELALTNQTGARCDLITEGLADLRDTKRHISRVLLQAELKIQEDTLGGLWPEVTPLSAQGADRSGEHQVERDGLREVILRVG